LLAFCSDSTAQKLKVISEQFLRKRAIKTAAEERFVFGNE
jgi:hypothetical protein